MALNTDYVYNVDKKYAKITFYDDGVELSYFQYDNSIITVGEIEGLVVTPTWGTNKDIVEWLSCLESMSGRLGLNYGTVHGGYEYEIKVDNIGVAGKFEANGEILSDWEWVSATNLLSIASRDEAEVSFAEFKSFVQWMRHFQYAVQNYGG